MLDKLVDQLSGVLKTAKTIISARPPNEQKQVIDSFIDRIEVDRKEGIAKCYFYGVPENPEGDDKLSQSEFIFRRGDNTFKFNRDHNVVKSSITRPSAM